MTQTMYAAVNTGPNQVEWRQLAKPRPGPGQVLIRTVACGICATDLEMIAGWERTGFPSIPGHEWSGVVEALGPGIEAGLLGCRCVAQNVWSDGGEVGFEHPGGYGQFFVTQASHVRVLPPSLPMHLAVLIEPLAVCIRGLTRARLKPQDHVLIVGDGTIGLLNLLLLKHDLGRRVAVVGGREHRLAAARALGADLALPHHAWPGPQALGFEPSLAIEASGKDAGLTLAMQSLPRGGRLLVLGDYGQARADFPWNQILHRELEIVGSNASAGAWDHAVVAAQASHQMLANLISHRFPAVDFHRALDTARSGNGIRVVIEWPA